MARKITHCRHLRLKRSNPVQSSSKNRAGLLRFARNGGRLFLFAHHAFALHKN